MYSPEIKPEKVEALYQLKLKTGKTLTTLVDEAVSEYLVRETGKYLKGTSAKQGTTEGKKETGAA